MNVISGRLRTNRFVPIGHPTTIAKVSVIVIPQISICKYPALAPRFDALDLLTPFKRTADGFK